MVGRNERYNLNVFGGRLLRSHEKDAEDFANTSKSTRVNLTDIDGLRLQKLFEHHAIVRVFSSSHTDAVGL